MQDHEVEETKDAEQETAERDVEDEANAEGDLPAPSHLGQAKYKSSMDKNGLSGVALDPVAIRTF